MKLWQKFDPNGTGWLNFDELIFFVYKLPFPFSKILSLKPYDDDL